MTTNYELRIYEGATLKGIVTDMIFLNYGRRVNDIGVCQFAIRDDHPYEAEVQKNRLVEVWRSTPEIPLYKEETYIVRSRKDEWNGARNDLIVTCISGNWLLASRVVGWKSGVANRSAFAAVAAETVAKTLVTYNLAASATTGNGRVVDGTNSLVTVQANGATGTALSLNCAFDNLLSTLRDVANLGGGDFNMVWTGSAWDFRWYGGQLGTDRSDSLVFSLQRGSLERPALTQDWLDEKTLAIVGGQGEGTSRNVRTRQGSDYAADNKIEIFVDARDIAAGDANENTLLDTRADAELSENEATVNLDFNIIQTEGVRYGLNYQLGDLGTVLYGSINQTVQVADVNVAFAPGQDEVITIGVANV